MTPRLRDAKTLDDFQHHALLYSGEKEYVARLTPFILGGIERREPTLVVVSPHKIELLRANVGRDDELVEYADMTDLGANPARIIPAWRDFAVRWTASEPRRLRGIGEPIWPGRGDAELAESQWHEALINRAFADDRGFVLVCPYDTAALQPHVIDEAFHSHPTVISGGVEAPSDGYIPAIQAAPLTAPLPQAGDDAVESAFDRESLATLRSFVARAGARRGLTPSRLEDLVFAANESATNSVRHGGERGTVRLWRDADAVVCEIRDSGVITDPLADRCRPAGSDAARGLWTANQLCDLVQVRSGPGVGSTVRMWVRVPAS